MHSRNWLEIPSTGTNETQSEEETGHIHQICFFYTLIVEFFPISNDQPNQKLHIINNQKPLNTCRVQSVILGSHRV